ncbi:UDP-glucose 4-epimerase GalE [Hymenobacter negativus]|uniref:UDP-glucose 4-epimerase n=1 Tax=Hymenobacter negativus TaxID=2795026 RepID=A0ABS0Q8V5_9BACT|nr:MULTISPECIES: UDP-glucose 4-epimerase GalE [Bacteria]MBH8558768.1 UDP-glucose 4-epimerase GalE [Hymenobacter negativus]MBH8570303.1 UDP-glucose 4-epimerase GalE [Hymenobacter negativus]MBR7210042.1 UDP-glucose 4-epimerase GalE [Microvirga sp. STS02]
MSKILVTGGAGYIGSHAVVALQQAGYQPVIVDNFSNSEESALAGIESILGVKVPTYRIDCADATALRGVFETENDIQGVIHFAAYKAVGESVAKPLMYFQNNVGSLLTLLGVMAEFKVHNLVFSSSCTVYGIPDALPVTENTPTKPASSPYGRTKQMCEDVVRDVSAAPTNELHTILLRYFNPIGAHESAKIGELPLGVPNNLVPFITQTAAGIREQLTINGGDYDTVDGTNIRDYIHVVDLAKAHVVAVQRLLDRKGSETVETFNVGTGHGNSVLEVVQTFERVSGQKLNYRIGPRRAGDVPAIYADATKAAEGLGFKTETSLADSLASAWKWQQALAKK